MRKEKEKRVLVVRLSAMGDVAICAPLVTAYATANPEVKFFMLSQPRYAPMFFGPSNLTFIPFSTKKGSKEYCGGVLSIIKKVRALARQNEITHIADIHDVLRTKVMRIALGAMFIKCGKIDKHRAERASLIAKENKVLRPITTSLRCMEEVFVALGFKDLHFAATGIPLVAEKNRQEGGAIKIGVAPFAAHKGKEWSLDFSEELVRDLSGNSQYRIYLYGGGDREVKILRSWAEKYPNTEVVAGMYTLQEELDSMAALDVMISMDSANMHLASLVGTPVVSVWGATHPYAGYYGRGQNLKNAVQVDLPCRPCSIFGAKRCHRGDYACLNNISPQMVLQRVYKVLEKKGEI